MNITFHSIINGHLTFPTLNDDSYFSFLGINTIRNIFSYVDAEGHDSLAQVCKTFHGIVNSGIEEGKNARKYLLSKMDIKQIDFVLTYDDLVELALDIKRFFPTVPEETLKLFKKQLIEIFRPSYNNKNIEDLNFIKDLVVKNIEEFAANNDELNNRSLAIIVQHSNAEELRNFIHELALNTLTHIMPQIRSSEVGMRLAQLMVPTEEVQQAFHIKFEAFRQEHLSHFVDPETHQETTHPELLELQLPEGIGMILGNDAAQLQEQFHLTDEQQQVLMNGGILQFTPEQADIAEVIALLIHERALAEEQELQSIRQEIDRIERKNRCTILACGLVFLAILVSHLYRSQFTGDHTDL